MTREEKIAEIKRLRDEQSAPAVKPSAPNALESLLRGAAAGGSLGFADELTGAGESALGSLGVVPDKTYQQARDESRAAYKAAQEANPVSYGAGEVGGTLATALVPGAALGTGLKGAMAAGALAGGLSSAGTSEKELNDPSLYTDAATSAATGAALGGALEKGAPLIAKGASKFAESSLGKSLLGGDAAQKMGKIYGKAREGLNLQGKDVTAGLNEELGTTAEDLVNYAKGKKDVANKMYSDILNPSKLENVRGTQEALEKLATDIERSPNAQALSGVKDKLRDLSAGADMYTHQQIIDEFITPMEQQLKAVYGPNVGAKKVEQIENLIYKNNPELSKAKDAVSKNYAETKTLLETMGVDPSLVTSKAIKKENIGTNNLVQNLRSSAKPGTPNYDKIQTLKSLLEDNPEMLQKLESAKGSAENLELNKALREAPSFTSGLGYNAANVAGLVEGNVSKAIGKGLNYIPERTMEIVKSVRPKLGNGAMGQHVDQILSNPDTIKRNQQIFTLMQQPWFRRVAPQDDEGN